MFGDSWSSPLKCRTSQSQCQPLVRGNRRVLEEFVQRVARWNVDDIEKEARIDSGAAHPARDGARELRAIQQRVGICPLLRLVAEALRSLRRPQRMAELPQRRHHVLA